MFKTLFIITMIFSSSLLAACAHKANKDCCSGQNESASECPMGKEGDHMKGEHKECKEGHHECKDDHDKDCKDDECATKH